MARQHDRARRLEQRVADMVGGERVKYRPRFARMPDVWPVTHKPTGITLQFEAKSGKERTPKTVLAAVEQARGYTPGAVPVAVFGDVGGELIACLPLADLARLLGMQPLGNAQLVIGCKVKQ
jgi:hypothetical protein